MCDQDFVFHRADVTEENTGSSKSATRDEATAIGRRAGPGLFFGLIREEPQTSSL